ncbi:NifB/NifX family molybdenum-iron cluster-binding protein [Natroniella acetigena]|uniref:NifB/NifX family molybdenum-iron cluster-binding protein n=1 Tax=Natroniella acetigena TaxID=52004 RepID=UPI00200AC384|nr:NifB/NifX family molybdenum-iron cluster-binding protein [Natroniella acetigena]MCK8827663.1 NifB/NifX family molybdenum-iron cluster-binding protein [Natroniella acetigena]
MKLVITAKDDIGFESELDTRFGRAAYFGIIDIEGKELIFIKNEATSSSSGAGIKAAQLLADKKADALITGRVGPKAFRGLEKAGIKVYTSSNGEVSIQDCLTAYKAGELKEVDGPTNQGHHGLK